MLLQQNPGIRAVLEGVSGYSHTVVDAAVVDPSDRILAHSDPTLEERFCRRARVSSALTDDIAPTTCMPPGIPPVAAEHP